MIEYLVYAAAAATLLAALAYIRSMFKGGAKPNRVSWLMWAIAPFIAVAASASSGVGLAVVPVFMAGFGPFLIFVASFLTKKAYWQLSKFDYFCGFLSALALVFWYLTMNPNVAILLSIASDGLATVPTLTKAWNYPRTESIWPFATGIFGASAGLAVAKPWVFSAYAFPFYLLIVNAMVLAAIYKKKLFPFTSN
ncbi:MAG TPA: hypothetical protein VMD05_03565 [Candidatus Nanoarchaeia archaeon]|nr:hypothetical protein [Candidatus Nanoarchaeia archaeon]